MGKIIDFLSRSSIGNVLLILSFCCYLAYFVKDENIIKSSISSDGYGYYAYLPAFFLLDDKTCEKTNQILYERYNHKTWIALKIDENRNVNKYFAGVSLMALPGFLITTLIVKMSGDVPDGYNLTYYYAMFISSILFFIVVFLLYTKTVKKYFNFSFKNNWLLLFLFFVTPWFYYSVYAVMFANTYLIFVFVLLMCAIIKIKENEKISIWFYLVGLLIGLTAITRPTSLVVVLFFPYFFDSWQDFVSKLKFYFSSFKAIFIFIILLLIPIFIQFYLWKWQTDSYFLWSYSGEGFNWTNPKLFEVLFGYKNGMLFHSPVLLLCLLYVFATFRENKFKSIFYIILFLGITYISASWWCFDFETRYGLRNFTEFYVFLLLPLFDMMKNERLRKYFILPLALCFILSFVRFNQYVFDYNHIQRFTKNTYWKSLQFWKKENKQRFFFYTSTPPLGVKYDNEVIWKDLGVTTNEKNEFYLTEKRMIHVSPKNRAYIKFSMQKEYVENIDKQPILVIDYTDNDKDDINRAYISLPLYNDKLDDKEYVTLEFNLSNNLEKRNTIGVYIWNLYKTKNSYKNVNLEIEYYK